MKKILLLCFCWLIAFGVRAQQRTVTGKVTDAADGSSLPGVSVLVKGTTHGTVTDASGNFTIDAASTDVLSFSFIGFEPQEVTVGERSAISISLTGSVSQLQEVVVIGYGEREKKDLTGAISTVSSEDITKTVQMSPEMTMQGRMAGVMVSTPSGSPFARPTVRIRGVSSWNNAEPLYVIDGVPVLEGGANSGNAGYEDIRSPININSLINPNDIESISVLKDASAAAIYGVRASNGVILITTKKGKAGRPKIELSAQRGVQNLRKTFDMLNTQQYTQLYQEAYANNPVETANLPAVFNPSNPSYMGNSPTYNWQNNLQNKNALIEDYSLRVSGGNEATTYYVSTGYGKTEGSLIQNYLQRYSLASNITSKVNKYIETGLNMKLAYNKALDNTGTDLSYVATAPPWQPITDPNDPTGYAPAVTNTFVPNPDFDLNLKNPGPKYNFAGDPTYLYGPASRGNVFATQNMSNRTFDVYRTLGNAYLQIEPLKGLKIKGTLSADFSFNLRKEWNEYANWRFSQTPSNPYSNNDGTAKGSYGERQTRNFNLIKEFSVNYNRTFGDHNIDLLFNAMDQKFTWTYTDASTGQVNYTDPAFRVVMNNPPFSGAFTGRIPQALQGYLGRLSYKFQDKYYLDATIRRDGTSVFAPGYRWGTFASVGAGWRISSESFFQNLNIQQINDLKFRGGVGELGNKETVEPDEFAYLSRVISGPDVAFGSGNGNPYGTQIPGNRLPNFPNFQLTWERVRTTNIGFDARLFDNHVTFTAEYYDRYTKGVIQGVQLPPNAGIQSVTKLNIGNVRNNGIELDLGYNTNIGDIAFNFSGNFTTNKNRVVKMYQGTPIQGSTSNMRIQEGQPINFLYGYKTGGIFQNTQEITQWKTTNADNIGTNNQQPGDMYFKDIAGNPESGKFYNPTPDGVINTNDRQYLGKTIPGFFYGFNFGASYKGIDVSIFFQGIGDVQKYNDARAGGEGMSSNGANQWTTVLNRWTPENPSTTMPRAVRNDPNANNRFSDRFVENAGFMRLKNAQIGYSLPQAFLAKTGSIDRVRIYVSGTNLLTFTHWTGIDPENDFVPPTRQILVGLNASF